MLWFKQIGFTIPVSWFLYKIEEQSYRYPEQMYLFQFLEKIIN